MGDTIVTTDYSTIFPGCAHRHGREFSLHNATFYNVKVKLHSNIAALGNVLAVKYLDAGERNALEESVTNPEHLLIRRNGAGRPAKYSSQKYQGELKLPKIYGHM